jgi:release factor glutamine methyltransferase
LLISEALELATDKFSAAGVLSPSVDAELLGCFILGIDRSELTLLAIGNQSFPEDKLPQFLEAVQRREKREPLQHITGSAPFRHLELEVGPGVFIPRPETEQLVELVMEKIQKVNSPLIVDLCSGSGAIAISLSTELESATVYAVELSNEAFQYLIRNFQKYGLDTKTLRNENLTTALDEHQGQVDMVVSNPPYIPDAAVPIDLEVKLHDPSVALYGGEDGLDVIREISTRALYLLRPGGYLVLEHANTQAPAIGELLLSQGWQEIVSSQDLTGKNRMISAVRPERQRQ